jgi:glutaredoxin
MGKKTGPKNTPRKPGSNLKRKIKIYASPKCGLCKSQKKLIKKYHLEESFTIVSADSKKGAELKEKAKEKGLKIEGKPTFVDLKTGLNDTGLRGKEGLRNLIKKAEKMQNSKKIKKQ